MTKMAITIIIFCLLLLIGAGCAENPSKCTLEGQIQELKKSPETDKQGDRDLGSGADKETLEK